MSGIISAISAVVSGVSSLVSGVSSLFSSGGAGTAGGVVSDTAGTAAQQVKNVATQAANSGFTSIDQAITAAQQGSSSANTFVSGAGLSSIGTDGLYVNSAGTVVGQASNAASQLSPSELSQLSSLNLSSPSSLASANASQVADLQKAGVFGNALTADQATIASLQTGSSLITDPTTGMSYQFNSPAASNTPSSLTPSQLAQQVGPYIGAASAVGNLASGIIGSQAAVNAANTQANAQTSAAQAQLAMFNATQANLAPYMQLGAGALPALQGMTGTGPGGNPATAPLTAKFNPTMTSLAATPGYQFNLQQGELAAQNSYAAQGLGSSGAAEKGAINYASGLASTTYQQQFANYMAQNQQIYNMLGGEVSTGQNAATNIMSGGLQSQSQANALTVGAASSTAAGIIGSSNAVSNGLTGAATNAAAAYGLANASSTTNNP